MNLPNTHIRVAVIAALAFAGILSARSTYAIDAPKDDRVIGGFFVHDRGPTADRHEDGFDVNLEYQFAAPDWEIWQLLGSPRPHAGVTISTDNETSFLYSGITYEIGFLGRLFAAAHGGLALHDGALHQKDTRRCGDLSDCGFGSRVLLRGGLELGTRISETTSISFLWNHISHGGLLAAENEGVDHIGLRIGFDL
jgi:hypothetical protein